MGRLAYVPLGGQSLTPLEPDLRLSEFAADVPLARVCQIQSAERRARAALARRAAEEEAYWNQRRERVLAKKVEKLKAGELVPREARVEPGLLPVDPFVGQTFVTASGHSTVAFMGHPSQLAVAGASSYGRRYNRLDPRERTYYYDEPDGPTSLADDPALLAALLGGS
jgi:hypothetical protein